MPTHSFFILCCLSLLSFPVFSCPYNLNLQWTTANVKFNAEIVDTIKSRKKGLMFRKKLPQFSAMLFVYNHAQPISFWMKNTSLPLDILFFDATKHLVKIHQNAIPFDKTPIFGGNFIQYILEINAGMSQKLKIPLGANFNLTTGLCH